MHRVIWQLDPVQLLTPPKGLEVGYVPIAVYEGLSKPSGCSSSPSPGPTPPPTPPAPAPPAANSLTIFESGGNGKLTILASEFTANSKSSRGGALAWDACSGAKFDNGHPIWSDGQGTHIGQFKVNGDWKLRVSDKCGVSFDYPGMSVSREYSKVDGSSSFDGLVYFEEVQDSLEFV